MKAAYITETGGAHVIQYGDLPQPTIKDHEVLVRVKAVALDHVDTYIRSGKFPLTEALPSPFIIGRDMVGVVEEVGEHVEGFTLGERVWANALGCNGRQGSFAEYLAVDQELVYPAPAGVEDVDIVSVVHSAATACRGLIRFAKLKAQETILIYGAGGNVGTALVQLSSARGAKVIAATSGKEKMEWCKSCGAELVLDYKSPDFDDQVLENTYDGVDVFWDTSRQPNFDRSIKLVRHGGRIVLMAGPSARPEFPVSAFYRKECALFGFILTTAGVKELQDYSFIINRCIEERVLKPKVAEVLPLSEARTAHKMLESDPHLWGKIVLVT